MTAARLARAIPGVTLEEARKVVAAITRGHSISEPIAGVRRTAMEALRASGHVPTLTVVGEQSSREDSFRKLVLSTHEGHAIETVRIPLEKAGRFSVCVSSQAGCALACAFCATGRLGLKRNLEPWEIVEQVRLVKRTLNVRAGERIHGVVFQGMGEPMANIERVIEAVEVLSEPSGLAIDARNVTVCTAGLPAGIRKLMLACPQVRLALSIFSARGDIRRGLMPIDRAHPLEEVIEAAADHARVTGLAPLWAVTLLADVNDSREDAEALARLARSCAERTGVRPRVTVVPYNRIHGEEDPFRRVSHGVLTAFRDTMAAFGFVPHVRYSGGHDVGAACGQLTGRVHGPP
ncbi:MAG: 23S rRNA (adenine(2503)-C(2))-methyltransferase RlmN [Myxococcales bacterium]|nr:23S rRNA (adenine(2503)-C(2))-methyltransferase RlmN [Polyangiaceae bacterium]MDW8248503.1 23S rRNA (adenine(2503)-C(2))-methyltransferase RlmN [Myxococcales bacterium]